MMKIHLQKLLVYLIVFAMLLTHLPGGYAQLSAAETQREAWLAVQLPLLKERFQLQDYNLRSCEYDDSNPEGFWFALLYFVHQQDPVVAEQFLIVNEAGEVVNYAQYQAGSQGMFSEPPAELRFPAYTKDELLTKMEEFLARAFPELQGQVTPLPVIRIHRDATAYISMQRLYRGIPVEGDYLNIEMDQQTGEVTRVARWHTGNPLRESTYPATLSETEAWSALRRQQALELVWAWQYSDDRYSSTAQLRLEYRFRDYPLYLDAGTGEILQFTKMLTPSSGGINWRELEHFNEVEKDQQISQGSLLNPQQAIEVLISFPGLNLQGFELDSHNYYLYQKTVVAICLYLSGRDEDGQRNRGRYTIWVDGHTGKPLVIDGLMPVTANSTADGAEQLSATAMTILELTVPYLLPQLRLGDAPLTGVWQYAMSHSDTEDLNLIQFRYPRMVQGFPFYDHEIVVTFASDTGDLLGYNVSWDETTEFPALKPAISTVEAYDILRRAYPLQLSYRPHYLSTQMYHPPVGAWEANLVYHNNELTWATLDAVSGMPLYQRPAEEEGEYHFTDLANHPLEEQILRTLSYLGLPGSGEFRPDDIVTQIEFFTWLNMLHRYANNEDRRGFIISNMVGRGVVSESEVFPARELTQMDGIVLLVHNLGLRRYTRLSAGVYKNPLGLPQREAAYLALAAGLKITDFDSFQPEALLTRSEAIMLIHNYLAR